MELTHCEDGQPALSLCCKYINHRYETKHCFTAEPFDFQETSPIQHQAEGKVMESLNVEKKVLI